MKTLKIIFLFLFPILFLSCQKDNFDDSNTPNNSTQAVEQNGSIKNGIFIFNSRDDLKTTVTEMKKKGMENQYSEFENYYKKGFRSLQPMVDPDNKNLISKLSEDIIKKRKTKNSESEEPLNIVVDPYLAAFVNEDNEIIVNDSLYKFTEKGLFFAAVKDSTHLFNYLKNNKSSTTKMNAPEPCILRTQFGGSTQIDAQITRYIVPVNGDCEYGGGGGGGSTPPPIPQLTSEEKLQNIIQNLPICDGKAGGNWVQGLFGKSFVCRNYYNDGDRIKTEFWDQNFLFYKSVGIQVKTQTQTLGVWWASDSDEIHLGINRILLKYDFPQPQINSYTFNGGLITTPYKAPVYMYGGKFLVKSVGSEYFSDIQLKITQNALPFFRLDDNPILNIYIPNLPLIGDYNFNYNASDITSDSNIKALYKMGIDFLKKQASAGAPKVFAVTYQRSYNNIETLYFGQHFSNINDNKIEKKFYEDYGFKLGVGKDENNGWSFSVAPDTEFFRNYTYYEVDFYGAARRGSTWKGNRMIRN